MTLGPAAFPLALAGVLIFLLPGAALLQWLRPGLLARDWLSGLGISAGISAAAYPLWFLLADWVGWRAGAVLAWAPPAAAVLGLGWLGLRRIRQGDSSASTLGGIRLKPSLPDWVGLGLLFLVAFTRVAPAWRLVAPLWGDSVQHTMITQLILDHGGLFQSWEPYAQLETFTYHFGFHALAASIAWISGLEARAAVLWTGQILNILAVLALYPLAASLWRSRWAGVVAILVAGLLLPIPMIYVNWGRYTQLAGQVILPAAVVLAHRTLADQDRPPVWPWLASLCMAGLALTHYRVLAFGAAAYAALAVRSALNHRRIWPIIWTGWIAAGSLLVVAPWLVRVFDGRLSDLAASQLSTPAGAGSVWEQLNALPSGSLFIYAGPAAWMAGALGWLAGFRLGRRPTGFLTLWWFLILLAAAPALIRLPGTGLIGSFTVLVASYIPLSLLAAGLAPIATQLRLRLIGTLFPDQEGQAGRSFLTPAAALVVLAAGVWGAPQRLAEIDEARAGLVTEADLRAADWISEHVSQEAVFYVNQFFGFADSVTVGSDAGWWLPLLAGRRTTLPPINYTLERGPRPDYVRWVNELPRQVQKEGLTAADTLDMLLDRGVTHIFVGQRGGRVNYDGPDIIDPQALEKSSSFILLYQEAGVWIFELSPETEPP